MDQTPGIDVFGVYHRRWLDAAMTTQRNITELVALGLHHGHGLAATHAETVSLAHTALYGIGRQMAVANVFQAATEYMGDCCQRTVLFLDTLRQRGTSYIERERDGFKPVLVFDYDLVVDGRRLDRPVNYSLVRIRPPEGFAPQREDGRPWVIIDPRAGHGSGIGGFKSESEVGVALEDGHPVYFVIFYPDPEPGQTLADVCAAEAAFLREIRQRHPGSPKPLITGNCQGGWASMVLAATHPELMGPVVIAGAPLSYWAGEKGKNPFRYLGGIAGGAMPALLISDLGGGKFDGAHLVYNFEQLNPGKTWWRKNYDLFAGVDDEAGRFLDFERWWSGFYLMNENEIRWIIENLFIGNRLTRGEAVLNDGTPIDLTRIEAPVVVFASHGDNITPPQQALNWIADLYGSVKELQARGHVIVYTLHDSIGHLGIFVSAKVANKQHRQITSVVKTIEALAPGLYEMLIAQQDGAYEVSFEVRSIEDILAHDDGREEESDFATVARLSEWTAKSYELFCRPFLRQLITPTLAEIVKQMHPMRQERYFFSDRNPMMFGLQELAADARATRRRASPDNPFIRLETFCAGIVERNWDAFRDIRDGWAEMLFYSLYGMPWMRQLGELDEKPVAPRDIRMFPQVQDAVAKAASGGYAEAIIRMLILLARARGSVRRDRLERSNKVLQGRAPFDTMKPDHRSQLIHEQTMIVEFTGKEAISTLPELLKDEVDRIRAIDLVLEIAGPPDEMDAPTIAMFERLQNILMTRARDWTDPAHHVAAHEPVENGRARTDHRRHVFFGAADG